MRPLEKGFWFVAETLSSIFTHSGAATARRCHPLGRNRSSWTAPRQSQWQCRRTRSRASPLSLTWGDYLGQYICNDLTFSTRIYEWSQARVRATRNMDNLTDCVNINMDWAGWVYRWVRHYKDNFDDKITFRLPTRILSLVELCWLHSWWWCPTPSVCLCDNKDVNEQLPNSQHFLKWREGESLLWRKPFDLMILFPDWWN